MRITIVPSIKVSSAPQIADVVNRIIPVIKSQQKMFDTNKFRFLNRECHIQQPEDWNLPSMDKLWLYNLHYFDDLNSTNSERRLEWHFDLIENWIHYNPLGDGNGWEPYPSSVRIVNWIKWFLANNIYQQDWLDSLANQTRFLSKNLEYHILGNHLFANAKALIFSGLYFRGPEADEWYLSGIRILNKEMSEQVLSDGGNFELSPMYHAIFLEDLFDIINIHQVYEKKLNENIEATAVKMLRWLELMCHPDGEVSFFNDSVFDVAPTLEKLRDYSTRLGVFCDNVCHSQLTYLKESGYIRANIGDVSLIADVASIGPDYLPGHGHADALSFELSLFNKRVVVNSGVSTYEAGSNRSAQRGTLSHATITIDNTNSSEVWGGFRVARRAKVFNVNSSQEGVETLFSACHDGYTRLGGEIFHCRQWGVYKNLIRIVDRISGTGNHLVTSVLPLHPKVQVVEVHDNNVTLEIEGARLEINFIGTGVLSVEDSYYHPEFGRSIDSKKLVYSCDASLPLETSIEIIW